MAAVQEMAAAADLKLRLPSLRWTKVLKPQLKWSFFFLPNTDSLKGLKVKRHHNKSLNKKARVLSSSPHIGGTTGIDQHPINSPQTNKSHFVS